MARAGRVSAGLLVCLALVACGDRQTAAPPDDKGTFGPNVPVDMAILLDENISDDELTHFMHSHLKIPSSTGEGLAHVDGVRTVQADYGTKVVVVGFDGDVSAENMEDIISRVRTSPIVERLEFDVVPSDVYAERGR